MAHYLEIALNLPLSGTYTYRSEQDVPAGCRVSVNFRGRALTGVVLDSSSAAPTADYAIKDVSGIIDAEPLLTPELLELSQWMAAMYFCSRGEALAVMASLGKQERDGTDSGGLEETLAENAVTLSDEQRQAVERIAAGTESMFYLYGITGSGKTEVFLHAAATVLAKGQSVIYLVPEIALTGQVVEAVRKRFGGVAAVLHSRLTPSQRLKEWRRIRQGQARLVIGARSAVFAPVQSLGLVILDEEHESSYKAGSNPRYHARQVAMRRAASEKAVLVMGSATPSLEAWHACLEGRMTRLDLTRRLAGGSMPRMEIVRLQPGGAAFSPRLCEAVVEAGREKRQSILFLNRRGFSHNLHCRSCGWELKCKRCSVGLTWHKSRNLLLCHYCGFRGRTVSQCPDCGSLEIGYSAFGTERIEEDARLVFPELRIERVDTDSVRKRGSLDGILGRFRQGDTDVLLGTQMVAKGLNFPGVKVVGIVLADTSLHLPDFRAAERTFALITQVSGRAGRFSPDGVVVIQTFQPDTPAIAYALQGDLEGFYEEELAVRKAQGFPPYTRLIRLVVRGKNLNQVRSSAADLGQKLREGLQEREVLGPAECPLGMVSGNHRWQILVRTDTFAAAHRAVGHALASFQVPRGVYIEPDPDPVSLL